MRGIEWVERRHAWKGITDARYRASAATTGVLADGRAKGRGRLRAHRRDRCLGTGYEVPIVFVFQRRRRRHGDARSVGGTDAELTAWGVAVRGVVV